MATIQVNCRFFNQSEPVRKHGIGAADFQRFRCLDCKRSFQFDYAYEAYKPRVKEQIVDMARLCFHTQPTLSFDISRRLGSSRAYQAA